MHDYSPAGSTGSAHEQPTNSARTAHERRTKGANPFRLKTLETGAVILPPHQLGKR